MDSLESRIAYHFKQPELLEEALTHPSFTLESKPPHRHNQRLEFLGDAVLQLVLSETLFHRFPLEDEGLLTKHRSRLVQNRPLAAIATRLSLGQAIRLGKGTETIGGRTRESILADAMESVIGAVYLDGGLDAARRFILLHWVAELEGLRLSPIDINPKGQLQELLQGEAGLAPTYRIDAAQGPDHEKLFKAVVVWRGRDLATGTGRTKKEAESDAAQRALKLPEITRLLPTAPTQRAT
jgi:ribonuclease-3